MILLACDTSTKSLSVALCEDKILLAQKTENTGLVHSRALIPLIQDILSQTGMEPGNIDCFGCTTGPGSFTGIRIGICVIKGMAYALGKPAAGVSTLAVLARPFFKQADLIIPMIDARNRRVFSGYFTQKSDASSISPAEAGRTVDDLLVGLKERLTSGAYPIQSILFCGDCADYYEQDTEFRGKLQGIDEHSLIKMIAFKRSDPQAFDAAAMIYEQYQQSPQAFFDEKNPFFLTENYLVPSGAERKRQNS